MTSRLEQQLILHEGLRRFPYTDTVGKLTIGVGRNLTDSGISTDEALTLLRHDLAACRRDLETFDWWDDQNTVRQRALLDLRFNLGPKGFRSFVNTLRYIAAGQYDHAADNLLDSKWATQVQPERVKRIESMLRSGVDAF